MKEGESEEALRLAKLRQRGILELIHSRNQLARFTPSLLIYVRERKHFLIALGIYYHNFVCMYRARPYLSLAPFYCTHACVSLLS